MNNRKLDIKSIQAFQKIIFNFYKSEGRLFPWRETEDPYAILVSEVMLQQTQAPRVEKKFLQFIDQFPTFNALSVAPLDQLLATWQGLGYNRRAIYLKRSAEYVTQHWGGVLPNDQGLLTHLPGIGSNTAGAICAYAFNSPVIFIETNIRRVFIHHFFQDEEDITDTAILPIVEAALPKKRAREWYNALMDYGTMLKAVGDNPNRKSRHHSKQSAFAGSDRQVRGNVLKTLLKKKRASLSDLALTLQAEESRISKIVRAMAEEGFLVCDNENRYQIKP